MKLGCIDQIFKSGGGLIYSTLNKYYLKLEAMSKDARRVFKLDTLEITERRDGYWLYDYTQGWNIVVRAETEQDACIEALLWYQKQFAKLKVEHKALRDKVNTFLESIVVKDDE